MIRLICRQRDSTDYPNGIDDVPTITMKTFDGDLAAMEAWLKDQVPYVGRMFVGIEILPDREDVMQGPDAPPTLSEIRAQEGM